jgi:hypothetical protein
VHLRSFFGALVLVVAPCAVQAGNPHIIIKDPSGNPTPITGNSFTFGADALGGGVFFFQNESGTNWFSMGVEAVLPAFTSITVTPGPFLSDTIVQTPQGDNQVLYDIIFGPAKNAIPVGTIFSINLNDEGDDPNGVGSWGPGNDFSARSNVAITPEPSTALLLLAGGVLAGLFRYWRRPSLG